MDNETLNLADPLACADSALARLVVQETEPATALDHCAQSLETVCLALQEEGQNNLFQLVDGLQRFVSAASLLCRDADSEVVGILIPFAQGVREAIQTLQHWSQGESESAGNLSVQLAELFERWGDCLGVGEGDLDAFSLMAYPDPEDEQRVGDALPSDDEVRQLLRALGGSQIPRDDSAERLAEVSNGSHVSWDARQASVASPVAHTANASPTTSGTPRTKSKGVPTSEMIGTINDPEMRVAYLDDAQRCLASMEKSVLALEENPQQREPLKQLCRELHTLKGASGTVGLHALAEYLHSVEDALQECSESSSAQPDVEATLKCVDWVRAQVHALQASSGVAPPSHPAGALVDGGNTIDEVVDRDEETIRVKASRIDRLMDMLAELIMLRNQRETRIAEQESLRGEMVRCVTRLRLIHDRLRQSAAVSRVKLAEPGLAPWESLSGDSLSEVANDVLAVSRRMQELTTPIAEENHTVSRLVRQFRHELVELRRMPVAGLFRKLQRVVRDAARVESKKVRMHLVGEHAGIERTMQERLYEPLLHIVRNAVSHGIESEQDRITAGKDSVGNITLSAHGNPNLLVITIQDDGRGLDYDSLRRRGLEMGLLAPDRSPTKDELSQLIFHPGFSTRKDVSAISGRGVGMDVVADTLQRMGAWIEIDSTPGKGTAMRLHIPLRSVIEHAMVFRAGGQLFAVPMQFVKQVGEPAQHGFRDSHDKNDVPLYKLPFSTLFGLPSGGSGEASTLIVLGDGQGATQATTTIASRRLGIGVDEIVGPEEVVVRSLPPLVQKDRMFSGIALASSGNTVLMVDGTRLLDFAFQNPSLPHRVSPPARSGSVPARLPILVADDSFSIRRDMVRMLQSLGYRVVEAGDGMEARQLLRQQEYAMVFSDLEMPRMDGFELLQEIKRDRRVSRLPVVIASSRNESACRLRALELGATEYLVKPVALSRIQEVLQNLATVSAKDTTSEELAILP